MRETLWMPIVPWWEDLLCIFVKCIRSRECFVWAGSIMFLGEAVTTPPWDMTWGAGCGTIICGCGIIWVAW